MLYNWLNKIYTTRILRAIMTRVVLLKSEPVKKIDVREVSPRVPPEKYRENLRKIVEYGRERKIPVVFILLKDNPYYTSQIRMGLAYRERGDYEHAIRAFTIGQTNTITGTMSRKFLAAVLAHREVAPLLSDEHFSVDGTLIKAWASMKSFQPRPQDRPPDDGGPGEPPAAAAGGSVTPAPIGTDRRAARAPTSVAAASAVGEPPAQTQIAPAAP